MAYFHSTLMCTDSFDYCSKIELFGVETTSYKNNLSILELAKSFPLSTKSYIDITLSEKCGIGPVCNRITASLGLS